MSETLRAPRLEVAANGTRLAGAVAAEVSSNNHYSADRFSVSLALSADPAALDLWAAGGEIMIDIAMGIGGAGTSLIQGAVDRVSIDPIRRAVRLDGRDLTARLIEARTQEAFVNRTASEIAETLAARHGLEADITPTRTKAGRYYQDEHDRITLGLFSRAMTEWDLLTWLARQEGFDVYVRGRTLHFHPPAEAPRAHALSVADVMDLRLDRALHLAREIEVVVKSWNSRQQQAFTQTARAPGPRGGGAAGQRQRVVLVRPNLTTEQALQLAQATLRELTRHRLAIRLTMPGETAIMPRDALRLSGSNSAFDQTYMVDEVTRRLSLAHGFTQHIRARTDFTGDGATPPAARVGAGMG
jgi:phage protein D